MARHIDPGLTDLQYRQKQAFVDDISLQISKSSAELAGLSRETSRRIADEAGDTRETFIAEGAATREALAYENKATREAIAAEGEATRETLLDGFTALGHLTAAGFKMLNETTTEGFETIHVDLHENTEAVRAVSSTLELGFAHIDARLGALATSFDELIRIAKTPEQTWAYEQYHVALEAFRRRLFDDALENITRALSGYGTHPGYRLEHRFHRLLGLTHETASDATIFDLAKAEQAYLTAVRYAEGVDKVEAASCLLRAAQLAYHRGDTAEAEQRSRKALELHASADGLFLLSKHMLANGKAPDNALDHLEQAIREKPIYFLLAASHPQHGSTNEFLAHEDKVRARAEKVRAELQADVAGAVAAEAHTLVHAERLLEAVRTQVRDLAQKDGWDDATFYREAYVACAAGDRLVTILGQVSNEGLFGAKAAHDQLHQVTSALADVEASVKPFVGESAELAKGMSGAVKGCVQRWEEKFEKSKREVVLRIEEERAKFFRGGVASFETKFAVTLAGLGFAAVVFLGMGLSPLFFWFSIPLSIAIFVGYKVSWSKDLREADRRATDAEWMRRESEDAAIKALHSRKKTLDLALAKIDAMTGAKVGEITNRREEIEEAEWSFERSMADARARLPAAKRTTRAHRAIPRLRPSDAILIEVAQIGKACEIVERGTYGDRRYARYGDGSIAAEGTIDFEWFTAFEDFQRKVDFINRHRRI